MWKKTTSIIVFFMLFSNITFSQKQNSEYLIDILRKNKNELFQKILNNPKKYKLQIIYTEIDRDNNNIPSFKNHYLYVDKNQYYYPASIVKLPLSLLSLEKLKQLNINGLNKFTSLEIDSAYSAQTREWKDTTSATGKPSLAHYIKKALLISENNPYNRMYEFLGQEYLNKRLWEKGYNDVRILRRFARFTEEENRYTNPIKFISKGGKVIYKQPLVYSNIKFEFPNPILIGEAHYDRDDKLINSPMDFSHQNNISLEDIHNILKSVMFPFSVPESQKFDITKEDYLFMRQYLSQFPGETNYPKYDRNIFYDNYVKLFFYDGQNHNLPDGVRVFNKVGWSYGFMTDVSYVVDFYNKIEYMLSATVYVNEDGILNDDNYEYDSIAKPFLYQLGQTVYNHELERKRVNIPDLSEFIIEYEKQEKDNRPTIVEADN